ncbi:MAG TPA: 3-hydroxyacyl-CoA dehydrogenase NAD-binding domain-containing protein [Bryobacteraceae bacterium]|nr:3-hydroxyacyl-CoA dehydrogenase NAD-binding domain-containing protein [Bryobacteraceae bacterium]
MNDLVLISRDGDVGILTVNNPPVNALSPGVPQGIASGVEQFEQDDAVKAIVLIGSGRTFIAGADIREFGKMTASSEGRRGPGFNAILDRIEKSSKPVVAAIHGTALGGGLETAMACHYRVAIPTALVGQPEVKLGIIPGAAGTQRLPRLAGVARAVEMCAGGDPISATDAHQAGIVDQIIEGDLLPGAVAFARTKIGALPRRTRDLNSKLGNEQTNAPIIAAARDATRKKQRNLIAPLAAIDAVEAATKLPFDEGVKREAELFQQCLFSDQSKGLIHVFFGEREVAKIPGIPKDIAQIPVNKAAVVGAGTMGGGIAMVFANAGIPVLLKETDQGALDRGLATIKKNYANSVKKGRFSPEQMDQRMARITPTLTYDGFDGVDMVIEAVFEGMALKKQIFGELDKIVKQGALLASNTSTLNIDEIASATSRPQWVIGTHFFSPANVMRLLEIVRGKATSKEVIATCMALSKKLGKVGVLVGNCRGFVGNRMFHPYRREAQFLVEEGATVEAVDQALYNFGMAMGPLATGDLAGLDVGWRIRKEFGDIRDTSTRQPLLEDRLCEKGMYGQKTGAGWYKYDADRKPMHNAEIDDLIAQARKDAAITPRTVSEDEIVDRIIYALVNEGARILEEGYALRAVDIDIIYINGYGFPAYRGGPMWYADTVGLKKVYARIQQFEKQHGNLWAPAPLLKQLAEEGRTFADFDKRVGETAASAAESRS